MAQTPVAASAQRMAKARNVAKTVESSTTDVKKVLPPPTKLQKAAQMISAQAKKTNFLNYVQSMKQKYNTGPDGEYRQIFKPSDF